MEANDQDEPRHSEPIEEQSFLLRTQEQLARSEEKYRMLFDSIDEGFCVIEVLFEGERPTDYRFLETNPAFEEQTGLKDASGHTARELVPDLDEHWFEVYGEIVQTGVARRFELPAAALGQEFKLLAALAILPEAVGNRGNRQRDEEDDDEFHKTLDSVRET